MKSYHNQHIGIYENSISDEWCDKVIEYFEDNIINSYLRPPSQTMKIRDTHISLEDPNLKKEFQYSFDTIYNLYQYKYLFTPGPHIINGYQIQKTLPTEGFHNFHSEQCTEFPNRSMVYNSLFLLMFSKYFFTESPIG